MKHKHLVSVQSGDAIEERVSRGLEDLGGITSLIPPGKTILLKPNLVVEKANSSGATTNPHVLEALLGQLKKTSPREIIVGEGAAVQRSTPKALQVSGVGDVAKKHGARVVDFQKDRYVKVPVPRGKALEHVMVARTVLDVDYLINVPILKMHARTRVTIALKNLKGCISDKEKKRFHRLELEQCIADLNTVIPVHLVVVDATVCSFAWEEGGSPVPMDSVLVSTNSVAVDSVGASLLGYHPREVEHIRLSAEHGLGSCEAGDIKILQKEKLQEIALPPESCRNLPSYHIPGLKVVEDGACTPCLGGVLAALRRLEGNKEIRKGAVLLGQRLEKDELVALSGVVLGIGSCGQKLAGKANSISGCPPLGGEIYEFLKARLERKEQ